MRALAEEVERSTDALHVLVSNAGIGSGRPDATTRQESRDGLELRLAVNHLAGFALTLRLLGLLSARPPRGSSSSPRSARRPSTSTTCSSSTTTTAAAPTPRASSRRSPPASSSPTASPGTGVTVTSLHPATYMPTKIVLEQAGRSVDTLEEGVEATVRLAVAPELEGVTGRFYDRQDEARAHPQAYEAEARRRLWDVSRALTGAPDVPPAGG